MLVMIRSRIFLLLGCLYVLFGLMCFTNSHADTLDNGLKEWDPFVIQGKIMDTGKDSIVIAEQWVMLIDTTARGKHLKTRIVNERGFDRPRVALKKGVLVLAKGGLAWDDKLKANVLLATEIQILDNPVNLQDERTRNRIKEQSRPW